MTAPLLVIHDRDDQDTLWSEGAALADAWPGARMMSTEGLGHRRILREPSVIEAAAEFVTA
jgi:pimeloyl-ACP methyl ester carboxylesterase